MNMSRVIPGQITNGHCEKQRRLREILRGAGAGRGAQRVQDWQATGYRTSSNTYTNTRGTLDKGTLPSAMLHSRVSRSRCTTPSESLNVPFPAGISQTRLVKTYDKQRTVSRRAAIFALSSSD